MHRPRIRLASIVSLGVLVACSDAAPPSRVEATVSASQPIIHGKVSDSSQDAVVLIEGLGANSFACSGTLLAPNLVLTARHCVSQLVSEGVQCDVRGNGTSASAIGADLVPGTLFIYVGVNRPTSFGANPAAKAMKIIHDSATNLCNHDLALLLLDRIIPDAKISPVRLDSPPLKTDTVLAVGWGISDTTAEPPQRMQRGGIKINAIGPNAVGTLPTPPNNFQVGESFCQGDSGGPGYAESTGAVIGVVSYGGNGSGDTTFPWSRCLDNGAGVFNVYTELSPFKDLILSAYQEAGQDPWLEGGPDPRLAKYNEPCTDGSACQSNLCYVDPKTHNGACTQDCSTDACPDGFDCSNDSAAGTKICKPHVASSSNASTGGKTGGCAAAPGSDASSSAWGAFAALALFGAARKRSRRGVTASRR